MLSSLATHRRGLSLLLVAGAVAGVIALGLVIGEAVSSNRSQLGTACVEVQRLETVIRAVLVQSLQTFGKKGSAGFAYYRAHPAELAAARVSLRHEIREFSGRAC